MYMIQNFTKQTGLTYNKLSEINVFDLSLTV
jgi:hypothetical protein